VSPAVPRPSVCVWGGVRAQAFTGPVKFVGGRLDRLHIRVHLWLVSRWIRRLLVVTGARCPLLKPVVTAVELQATTEPHCSRGVQPGGIYVYVVHREPPPGGPGSGLRPDRKRFLCASSDSILLSRLCQLPEQTIPFCSDFVFRFIVLARAAVLIRGAPYNRSADREKQTAS
jgi:hypothetical protein